MGKKVAYAVFEGHKPGVYNTWAEVEPQVKGYRGASQRGYRIDQGGLAQAQQDYDDFIDSKKIDWRKSLDLTKKVKQEIDDEVIVVEAKSCVRKERPNSWDDGYAASSKQPRLAPVDHSANDTLPVGPLSVRLDGFSILSTSHNVHISDPLDSYKQEKAGSTINAVHIARSSDTDEFPDDVHPFYADLIAPEDARRRPQEEAFTEPDLSPEQQRVLDTVMAGRNVFFTGSAGTGKSTTMKHITRALRKADRNPHIIAPTGKAALAINGTTDFVYAGWVPGSFRRPIKKLEAKAHGEMIWKRLFNTQVLIIDEISMFENLRFERLDRVLRSVKHKQFPFGGVQLIVAGDWCQLPPVKPFQYCMKCGRDFDRQTIRYKCLTPACGMQYDRSEKWAFCSEAWEACDFVNFNLKTVHRQSDPLFIGILEKYRLGNPLTSEEKELLLDHPSDTEDAVQLLPTRSEVSDVNELAFEQLTDPIVHYTAFDDFECHHPELEVKKERKEDGSLKALSDHSFEYNVQMRVGALVVLLVNLNIEAGLVNGSQGTIIGYRAHHPSLMPKQYGDYASRKQSLIGGFVERCKDKKWPIVRFTETGKEEMVHPVCRINDLGDDEPYSLLSRTQIPLIQAWALTIHKAQGMTLDRVIVNLAKAFEEGQVYVALSRARTLHGLTVESLEYRPIGGNWRVKEFLQEKFGIK